MSTAGSRHGTERFGSGELIAEFAPCSAQSKTRRRSTSTIRSIDPHKAIDGASPVRRSVQQVHGNLVFGGHVSPLAPATVVDARAARRVPSIESATSLPGSVLNAARGEAAGSPSELTAAACLCHQLRRKRALPEKSGSCT